MNALDKRIVKREKRVSRECKDQANQILMLEACLSDYDQALIDLTSRLEAIFNAGFNEGMSEAIKYPDDVEEG